MDYNTFTTPISEAEIAQIKDFDDILELVGSNGKYQKRLVYCVMVPFCFLFSIISYNYIFLFAVPNHSCHPPAGRKIRSLSQWKNHTIPREIGSDGSMKFSDCFMYVSPQNHTQIPCINGWDYDHTDYSATMASAFNWVCDKRSYPTQVLTAGSVGSVFGSILSGWIGDKFGRKSAFIGTCSILVLSSILRILLAEYFLLVLVMQFVAMSFVQTILVILLSLVAELTDPEARSRMYGIKDISWVIGNCFLPLIAWLSRDWFSLGLITSLPMGFLLLLTFKFIPESPRWLLSKNKFLEASGSLEKIANTNRVGRAFKSGDFVEVLKILKSKEQKEVQDFRDLFQKRRLGMHTALLAVTHVVNVVTYTGVVLNITNLSGNPFVDYFVMAIIELPASGLGVILAQKIGRRWPNTIAYGGCWIGLGLAVACTVCTQVTWMVLPSLFFVKFCLGIKPMLLTLQACEIFPTSLRTTGAGFVFTVAAVVNLVTPSLVFIGTTNPAIMYLVLCIFSFGGMVVASFTPETLHQTLPETVEDADQIGRNAKFWSFLPPDYKLKAENSGS